MLHSCHDAPSSGHQGVNKILARLRQEAYWVGMAEDVEVHYLKCIKCQMIVVDILEVPVSKNNNRYVMVVQDYFTKWAETKQLYSSPRS